MNTTSNSNTNYVAHQDRENHHSLPEYHHFDEEEENEVYVVKQKHGYLSILFSATQTIILVVMMVQCGVAPMSMNPMFGPYPDALSYWGGKNSYLILEEGEDWRLMTPIMLHAGVIHLLGNVAVQLETGAFFEREWGSLVWLIIYLTSAIGSSVLSMIFMPQSVSVGSSGSVMGLFGAKLAEVACKYCEKLKTRDQHVAHKVRMEMFGGVFCSVVVVMLFSFIPFVDWAAHLGGLISGFVVGMVLFAFSLRSKLSMFFWGVFGILSCVIFYAMSLEYMYNEVEPVEELSDVCEYYRQYFDDYECNCQLERDNNNGSGDNNSGGD